MMSGISLLITTAALVGADLAPRQWLSTLPLATLYIAMMLTSIPASLLMERTGRKKGFMLATLFSIAGATTATIAIIKGEFWLFVMGTTLIGVFNGFGNYFRFAAAEAVDETHKSRAVSMVLAGGVIAAFVGPNLANLMRNYIESALFAGSYAVLIMLYILSFIILKFIHLPSQTKNIDLRTKYEARPLNVIFMQPKFITALICGMFGYGIMNLVMTATPLAMHHHAHPFADTAFVIQWHALGMFAPSFITGYLIRNFGVLTILFIGGLLGLACVCINLLGSSVIHFWAALLLLGISWNFLFIGATVLLTETYRPEERTKTQAFNEFAVFSTVSMASLSSGAIQKTLGWQAVNIGVMPFLVLILVSIIWLWNINRKIKLRS